MQLEAALRSRPECPVVEAAPARDAHHRSRPLSPPTRPGRGTAATKALRSLVSSSGDPSSLCGAVQLSPGSPHRSNSQSFPLRRPSGRHSRSVLIDGQLRISLSGQTRRGKELSRRIMLPASPKWLGQRSVAVDQARHGPVIYLSVPHRVIHLQPSCHPFSVSKRFQSSSIDGPLCNPLSRSSHQGEGCVCRIAMFCPATAQLSFRSQRRAVDRERLARTSRSRRRSAPSTKLKH